MVGALTGLVTTHQCNILDSRIAILGCEFTFVMHLSGSPSAIMRFEQSLAHKSAELGLLTMSKPTQKAPSKAIAGGFILKYQGPDQSGTLSRISGLLASLGMDIGSLKSDLVDTEQGAIMLCEIEFNCFDLSKLAEFESAFDSIKSALQLHASLTQIR